MQPMPEYELTPDAKVARLKSGFPSPVDSEMEASLDLREYLETHPSATHYVRMAGSAMEPTIPAGCILVIERSLTPAPMELIVAIWQGELIVRRYSPERGRLLLLADHPDEPPIVIGAESEWEVWGVVAFSVHAHRQKEPRQR